MTITNKKLEDAFVKYESLLYEVENKIAIVTINRPPVNPLNTAVFKELTQLMTKLRAGKMSMPLF